MQREAFTWSATNTFAFHIIFNVNDPSITKFCSEKDQMFYAIQNKAINSE